MKVDWTLAPGWANFAVMCDNSEWYWFENEPIIDEKKGWWVNASSTVGGKCRGFQPHRHWKNSLSKREGDK